MLLNDLLIAGVLSQYQLAMPVNTDTTVDPDFGFVVVGSTVTVSCYFKTLSTQTTDRRPDGVPDTAKLVRAYFPESPPAALVANSKAQVYFDGNDSGWFVYHSLQGFASPIANRLLGQTLEGWYWPNR